MLLLRGRVRPAPSLPTYPSPREAWTWSGRGMGHSAAISLGAGASPKTLTGQPEKI